MSDAINTPWRVGNLESYDAYTGEPFRNVWAGGDAQGKGSECVARCLGGHCDERAAFIVEAVNSLAALHAHRRELLAACEDARKFIAGIGDAYLKLGRGDEQLAFLRAFSDRLDAAIEKAKGGAPCAS